MVQFVVYSLKEVKIILKHFDKYTLYTKKRADFELWKRAFDLINNKEHLNNEGLQKIVEIKAIINRGDLSENLLTVNC